MESKFRETKIIGDIKSLVRNSSERDTIVWQNDGHRRIIYNVKEFVFNEGLQTLQLTLDDYDGDFDETQTIYVKLSYRDTIFKGHVLSFLGSKLALYLPKDVRTQELRSGPRKKFKASDEKFVSISVQSDFSPNAAQSLNLRVIDISEKGMSLLVSDSNKALLESSVTLCVTHLGAYKLNEAIHFQVKYMNRIRFRLNGKSVSSIRAGIALASPINDMHLQLFSQAVQ